MRYKTILIDPPWNERGGGKCKRGADRHYNLMTLSQIQEYLHNELKDKIHDNCHLYLWVTNNYLESGLELIKRLGFIYKTNLVWIKDKMGLGQYFRGQHEICLFATRGDFYSNSNKISTVIKAKRTKHSKKPYHLYSIIEGVSSKPRLEIFARNKREGWEVIGNEVTICSQTLLKEQTTL